MRYPKMLLQPQIDLIGLFFGKRLFDVIDELLPPPTLNVLGDGVDNQFSVATP